MPIQLLPRLADPGHPPRLLRACFLSCTLCVPSPISDREWSRQPSSLVPLSPGDRMHPSLRAFHLGNTECCACGHLLGKVPLPPLISTVVTKHVRRPQSPRPQEPDRGQVLCASVSTSHDRNPCSHTLEGPPAHHLPSPATLGGGYYDQPPFYRGGD